MPKEAHKVVVIGHRNPDTDSICSAIAYAELKNKTSDLVCEPRRAGKMNQETQFVLQKFGVEPPRMCTDVNPQDPRRGLPRDGRRGRLHQPAPRLGDHAGPGHRHAAGGQPGERLLGVITVKDIATANMDVFDTAVLAKTHTTYKNILETLGGEMVVGSEDGVCTAGNVHIGTATPEMLESAVEKGDIVILTNRYESQLCAIEQEASLLIICNDSKVGKDHQPHRRRDRRGHHDRPLRHLRGRQAHQPVRPHLLLYDHPEHPQVHPGDASGRCDPRHGQEPPPLFPILDENGKYCGMVSRRNIINLRKRRIILVGPQRGHPGVEGFEQAEILEIIDHHRIGSLETSGPVYFRNQPVGCTATIVTQMYDEQGVEIRPQIAGLMLAAILSDTLMFRSPTCTPLDEKTAQRLAAIAGVDVEEFAAEMFEAGEKLDGKTPEEVFLQDFKVFMCGDLRFGVAQGSYMTHKNLQAAQNLLMPYLEEARRKQNVEDLYMMLTEVPRKESVVICTGRHAPKCCGPPSTGSPRPTAVGCCRGSSAGKSSSSRP